MRFDREEYIALMRFEDGARPMLTELFGLMPGLADEWRAQGASEDEINLKAFDLDYTDTVDCGGNCGAFGLSGPVTLEETAEYSIRRDELGRKTKLYKKYASIPLPLEYPVKDADGWLALKPLYAYREGRVDPDGISAAKKAQSAGALVTAWIPGGFYLPRELMGDEAACVCYYEDPELMHDILATVADTSLKVLERVSEQLTIDRLMVGEDLAGKSGPLVGPKQVREFIAPYYADVWELLATRGTRLFCQDSDGNLEAVLPDFIGAGLNVTYPCEPAAGMDIVALRKVYGERLAFCGGIDKHALRESRGAIERELTYKLRPEMRKGTAFGLDHRITDRTPIANYRYYIETAREMLGKAPLR